MLSPGVMLARSGPSPALMSLVSSATSVFYTLSLHDALPIWPMFVRTTLTYVVVALAAHALMLRLRSEEHTSELQSRGHLVCRLLLEKKKRKIIKDAAVVVADEVALDDDEAFMLIARSYVSGG